MSPGTKTFCPKYTTSFLLTLFSSSHFRGTQSQGGLRGGLLKAGLVAAWRARGHACFWLKVGELMLAQ